VGVALVTGVALVAGVPPVAVPRVRGAWRGRPRGPGGACRL